MGGANVPCFAVETGIITFPTQAAVGQLITMDPKEFWAPKYRLSKWKDVTQRPPNPWNGCVVSNPSDGFLYTQYSDGHIVKVNPKTYEAETIYIMPDGAALGLTFRPAEPNILYIMCRETAGVNANSLCTIDVTDPQNTFKRLSGVTIAGFRNGPIETAQFNAPRMAFSDADNNIYVADYGNHCIRRITPQNMVETVIGIPGTPGWKDGTTEEALFKTPMGLGISKDGIVYVADYGNGRVRKIAIN
jgi:hypothetical protein